MSVCTVQVSLPRKLQRRDRTASVPLLFGPSAKPQVRAIRSGLKGPKGLKLLVPAAWARVYARVRKAYPLHISGALITTKLGPFSPSVPGNMCSDLRK